MALDAKTQAFLEVLTEDAAIAFFREAAVMVRRLAAAPEARFEAGDVVLHRLANSYDRHLADLTAKRHRKGMQ